MYRELHTKCLGNTGIPPRYSVAQCVNLRGCLVALHGLWHGCCVHVDIPPDKEAHNCQILRSWWPRYQSTLPYQTSRQLFIQKPSDLKVSIWRALSCWKSNQPVKSAFKWGHNHVFSMFKCIARVMVGSAERKVQ